MQFLCSSDLFHACYVTHNQRCTNTHLFSFRNYQLPRQFDTPAMSCHSLQAATLKLLGNFLFWSMIWLLFSAFCIWCWVVPMCIRPLLYWYVTQQDRLVLENWHFRTIYRAHVRKLSSPLSSWATWPLKMGQLYCSEISVTNYQTMLFNIL